VTGPLLWKKVLEFLKNGQHKHAKKILLVKMLFLPFSLFKELQGFFSLKHQRLLYEVLFAGWAFVFQKYFLTFLPLRRTPAFF
jgi:hypothetical protein